MNNWGEKVSFIWSVADLLRGPYRPNQYKDVMLPLTVLRRLDCALERTKEQVLKRAEKLKGGKVTSIEPLLNASVGFSGIMPVPMATTQDFWNWYVARGLYPNTCCVYSGRCDKDSKLSQGAQFT